MSNEYTQCSFAFTYKTTEQRDFVKQMHGVLDQVADRCSGGEEAAWDEIQDLPKDLTPEYKEHVEALLGDWGWGWTLDVDDEHDSIYFYGMESPNLEAMVEMLRLWMNRFDIEERIMMTWAYISTRPITGAFGGGGVVFTKDRVYWHGVQTHLEELTADELNLMGTP